VLTLRESIRAWRFYDHFRADADAPARSPQIGTRTPVLDNDGRDLAAALQTIRENGDDAETLAATIDDAFPRSKLWIETNGRFAPMQQHGLLRPLDGAGCRTARCGTCGSRFSDSRPPG
jgi:predicted ATPase